MSKTTPPDPPDDKPRPKLRIAKPGEQPARPHKLSPGDRALLLDIVTNQIIDGAKERQIQALLRNAHENGIRTDPKDPNSPRRFLPLVSKATLNSLVRQVVSELEDDRKQSRERKVERMIARTMRVIRDASRVRNFSAVIQAEKHLASLEALYAPVHFTVGFDQRDSLLGIMAGMDNDTAVSLSERYLRDQRDAELYRTSVDALGESLPAKLPEPEDAPPEAGSGSAPP